MYRNLLNLLVLAVLLPSCSGTAPHISVVCEENNVGNCIVKWEMAPLIKGNVKVYASTNPEDIPEDVPIAIANISDLKMTVITTDPTQRYYYMLVFGDKYRVKIATRNINIPGIQNFRDLGGYTSYPTQKKVHWGMLYRSAEIDKLEPCSRKELKNIGIRTIIDLRSFDEAHRQSPLQQEFKVVHIPIPTGDMEHILKGVQERTIKSDTVHRIVERMNRELISNYTKEYRQIFDILLDKNNYPRHNPLLFRQRAQQALYRRLCLPPLEWAKTSSWKTTASATTTSTSRLPLGTLTSFRHVRKRLSPPYSQHAQIS